MSSARRRARPDNWLVTMAVAMKAASATQFSGSEMVNVPTGGRKKKLRHSIATTEAIVDSRMPHTVAMVRIASK